MRAFYRQEIHGDGACLFRSVACASFFAHCGYNLGRGCAFEAERNLDDVVLNGLTAWLRHHTMRALCSPDPPLIKAHALFDMCLELLTTHRDTPLDLGMIRDNFHQEKLEEIGEGSRVLTNIGMTARTLAHSGMKGGETFHGYCRRMQKPKEWGGCGELAILATQVLQCPAHLFHLVDSPSTTHLRRIQRKHVWPGGNDREGTPPPALDASIHLLYTGDHYEALLPFVDSV